MTNCAGVIIRQSNRNRNIKMSISKISKKKNLKKKGKISWRS